MANRAIDAFQLGSAIGHPGESGRAREGVLRRFLNEIIPPDFGVDTGFVVDAVGGISRQIDIVVYRKGRFPVLDVGGVKHFMVESVAAAIEVKAAVGSAELLHGALNNIESVKALDRTNGGQNTKLPSFVAVNPDDVRDQVWGGVVTGASMAADTCRDSVADWLDGHERRVWPNTYVDIAGFCLAYLRDGKLALPEMVDDPMNAKYLAVFRGIQRTWGMSPPLAFFAIDLLDFLRVTPVIDFSPSGYFYRTMIPDAQYVHLGDTEAPKSANSENS